VAGCPTQAVKAHQKFPGLVLARAQAVVWLGLPDPVSDNGELNSDKSVSETVLSLLASLYGARFKTSDLFRKYVAGDEKASDTVGALQALTHRRGRFENAIALGQALGVLVDREVLVDGVKKMRLCRGPRVASVTTWQVAGAANSSAKRPKTAQEGAQRAGRPAARQGFQGTLKRK
jgi:hypothetical protein